MCIVLSQLHITSNTPPSLNSPRLLPLLGQAAGYLGKHSACTAAHMTPMSTLPGGWPGWTKRHPCAWLPIQPNPIHVYMRQARGRQMYLAQCQVEGDLDRHFQSTMAAFAPSLTPARNCFRHGFSTVLTSIFQPHPAKHQNTIRFPLVHSRLDYCSPLMTPEFPIFRPTVRCQHLSTACKCPACDLEGCRSHHHA